MFKAKAPAADAAIEPVARAGEFGNAAIKPRADRRADRLPIARRWRAPLRQPGQFSLDFGKGQAEPLCNQDETQPPDIRPQKAPLIAAATHRFNQALVFVKPDRRNRQPGAVRDFSDGEEVGWFEARRHKWVAPK